MNNYFADNVAVWILGFLTFLYVGQILWAINDASKPIDEKYIGSNVDVQIRLYECLKVFDDGVRNMWVFFVLAVLLPVVLSTMADLVPIFQGGSKSRVPDDFAPSPELKLLYVICAGCIGVLMTLEFSYLHTLRKSAAEWIPMLLAALALDLIVLLVLNFVIRNPDVWDQSIAQTTVIALILATIVAITSSFCVLVLARVAGALHDGQIDISKVIDLKSKRYKKLEKTNE